MDIRNVVVAFFILVIVLVVIRIAPSGGETGYFMLPSASLEVAIILVIFSIFAIVAVILSRNKSYYPY